MNYYNDNDAYATQWLRNMIAVGDVADVRPDELDRSSPGTKEWAYVQRKRTESDDCVPRVAAVLIRAAMECGPLLQEKLCNRNPTSLSM